MRRMIAAGIKVQCIVTSPPYWGLRDYAAVGQYGLERTWVRHVARMRGVFRLARDLLADDGVLFLNYGDSYASAGSPGWQGKHGARGNRRHTQRALKRCGDGLKPKDMIGMPWRIAFALQEDGWYLRQDIIWSKPNPMPESARDRCTKAHEYVFLMSQSERYYWDYEAMQEDVGGGAHARRAKVPGNKTHKGVTAYAAGDEYSRTKAGLVDYADKVRRKSNPSMDAAIKDLVSKRNRRDVWTIASEPFREAHFATFPAALVVPCILAGSKPGDVIFDPFMGSGMVPSVAMSLGRQFIGCEINPAYAAMFKSSRSQQVGLAL